MTPEVVVTGLALAGGFGFALRMLTGKLQKEAAFWEKEARELGKEVASKDEKVRELEEEIASNYEIMCNRAEISDLKSALKYAREKAVDSISLRAYRKDGESVSDVGIVIDGHSYGRHYRKDFPGWISCEVGYGNPESGNYGEVWGFYPDGNQRAECITKLQEWALKYYRTDKDDEVQGQEEKAAEEVTVEAVPAEEAAS